MRKLLDADWHSSHRFPSGVRRGRNASGVEILSNSPLGMTATSTLLIINLWESGVKNLILFWVT